MRLVTAAVILLAAGLAAGCGRPAASGPRPSRASPAVTDPLASPVAEPPVSRRCGPPRAPGRLVTIRAADGVRLEAATAGKGRRGVVLVPERGPNGMCGWWDYAARLSRVGFRVLMFNHRCTGQSGCPAGTGDNGLMADIRGAAAWLRRAGVARIVLMGASQGASETVIAAAIPPRRVTGVVILSADELTTGLAGRPYPPTAMAAAPRLRLPALFAVAAGDPYVPVSATRQLAGRAGSPAKRLVVLPAGSGHGWDLVSPGSAGLSLRATIGAFLARVTS